MAGKRVKTNTAHFAGRADEQEEVLRKIIDFLPDPTLVIDAKDKAILWNKALAELTGVNADRVLGKSDYEYSIPFYGKRRPILANIALKPLSSAEKKYFYVKNNDGSLIAETFAPKCKNGKGAYLWVKAHSLYDKRGEIIGAIETMRDITERKETEDKMKSLYTGLLRSNKRLKQLAMRDSHTGLYNHRYLEDAIESAIAGAKRYDFPLSVMMLDIDYFKSINDVYGHQFGDLILKQLARLIKKISRISDTIVRYGGEEFVFILPSTDRKTANQLGLRILDTIGMTAFGNAKHTVKLKVSIAIASYPENQVHTGMDLVDLADQVLNKAKEFGGNRVYTTLDLNKKIHPLIKKVPETDEVKSLKTKIDRLNKRASQSVVEAIFAFAKSIEAKDHYTGEHGEKTVFYATEIAKILRLPREEIERIKMASLLHDLGKIGISEKILLKKGKLTKSEFEEIKKHPQIGADIIRPIQFLHNIFPLILHHHEKWDGTGYPTGLKGKEIPLGARIIAVADTFEALSSDRSYRNAFTPDIAIKIIRENMGTQFDPAVVNAFLKVVNLEKRINLATAAV